MKYLLLIGFIATLKVCAMEEENPENQNTKKQKRMDPAKFDRNANFYNSDKNLHYPKNPQDRTNKHNIGYVKALKKVGKNK